MASPVGEILIVTRGGTLCGLDFANQPERLEGWMRRRLGAVEATRNDDAHAPIHAALAAYFAGELAAVDALAVDGGGTPFQHQVWRALRTIAPGATATYADIARDIGRPRAVRAVGAANGANPISIVVPCHRVIGSGGALTGYAGGLERKSWLLEHERRYVRALSG
jgi:methylated-DNA-[protein]-cysteine S-methyltransferase